ncbi:MAG: sulfite exporter TauE/SafE family protein [Thermoleophilia bacterium]|nr:sulfite exporter TauE/SafE family protein [Thermoleophilia bacterium]
MDALTVQFPGSGVETWILLPPLVAFVVSTFTSMGGVSGAFILLPFQMSVLDFTTPSVSSTNFIYNIVAIPSGVYRYFKEGRMAWPLTWVVLVGTLPGLLIGYYLRIKYLPDPSSFKLFVGCVLLYIGGRLLYELTGRAKAGRNKRGDLDLKFAMRSRQIREQRQSRTAAGLPPEAVVKTVSFSIKRVEYEFWGERFGFSVPAMLLLAFVVGVIGGTYGIGGGAIIAPFCVAVFRLPIYTVAGAALLGTFLTSILGVAIYSVVPIAGADGVASTWPPDVALGVLFGIGGFAGMYLGARLQKHVPQKFIKLLLGVMILALALQYIGQYFLN